MSLHGTIERERELRSGTSPEHTGPGLNSQGTQVWKCYGPSPELAGPGPEDLQIGPRTLGTKSRATQDQDWTTHGTGPDSFQTRSGSGLDHPQNRPRRTLGKFLAQYRHLWENMLPLREVMRLMGKPSAQPQQDSINRGPQAKKGQQTYTETDNTPPPTTHPHFPFPLSETPTGICHLRRTKSSLLQEDLPGSVSGVFYLCQGVPDSLVP